VLLAWLLQLTSPFQALEARTVDWRFLFRGPQGERSAAIVLVLVEEEADLDYRSPIPRRHLAGVIEKLDEARLVGLDIILDQRSFDEEGDARLKQALARHGKVVAVSYIEDGKEYSPHLYFREALLDVGYATFPIGTEVEVLRRGTLLQDLEGGRALSLAAVLHAHYEGRDPARLRAGESAAGPAEIAAAGSLLINYAGPPNAAYRRGEEKLPGGFVVCPSHLVAAGVYPASFFRDRIVLVGTGLSDAPDQFRTPFFAQAYGYEKMLGVEVHAHFLQTLLAGARLRVWGIGRAVLLALVLGLVVSGAVFYADVIRSAGVLAGALILLWVAGFLLFSYGDTVIPLLLPSVGLIGAYGLTTAHYALTEGRERRNTRRLFEKYLSPEVIEQFLEDPSHWELGGKTMEVTVMFADLEGFTPLSEKLTPQELVQFINHFLNEMSAIILAHGGTIDKYEGDLIMAFWGAPLPVEDHPLQACRAALRMQARMEALRQAWRAQEFPELKVRIGIHSGPAVVGNMGSDFHFNYTVMGDTVNLASRLEGANKEFGTYTMISAAIQEQVGGELACRYLGETAVKGKSQLVAVYELLPASEES